MKGPKIYPESALIHRFDVYKKQSTDCLAMSRKVQLLYMYQGCPEGDISYHYFDIFTCRTWKKCHLKVRRAAPLVAQWLRIRLPMQGTRVQALAQEDPTCSRATKPVCHNYWACALEPSSHNYWAHVPHLLKPVHLEPVLYNKRSHHNKKPVHHNEE